MKLKDILTNENIDIIMKLSIEYGIMNIRIYPPTVPIEKNSLNLMVDLNNDVPCTKVMTLQWELEERLKVAVNATNEMLKSPFQINRIKEVAIPFILGKLNNFFQNNDYELNPPKTKPINPEIKPLERTKENKLQNVRSMIDEVKRMIDTLTDDSDLSELSNYIGKRRQLNQLNILAHKKLKQ